MFHSNVIPGLIRLATAKISNLFYPTPLTSDKALCDFVALGKDKADQMLLRMSFLFQRRKTVGPKRQTTLETWGKVNILTLAWIHTVR